MKHIVRLTIIAAILMVAFAVAASADPGAIWTSQGGCSDVNANLYASKGDIYLNGGPAGEGGKGLPEGDYFVRVISPGGDILGVSLTADAHVDSTGHFASCYKVWDLVVKTSDGSPGFDDTPNPGGEYKLQVSKDADFGGGTVKEDNFKVLCTKPATPAPTNDGPYCIGTDPITVQLHAGVTADSYSWSGPNGFTSSASDPTDTATAPGSYTYTLTVTVNNCTSDAGSTTVVVNANPAAPSPTNDGPYCFYSNPTTVQLHSNVAGMTYSWTSDGGFTSSNSDPTDSITAPGSYTYYLTVTDANGCSSAAGSTTVVVNAPPTVSVSVSGRTTFCIGGSVTLTATPAGNGPFTYKWSDGETTQAITVTSAGSYSVTVTDANGCSVTSTSTAVTTLICACTLTQGAYGSTGGAGSVSQVNALIGSGLLIGGSSRSFSFLATDAACLVLRMPAGGTPVALPSGASKFTSGYSSCTVSVSSMLKNGKFNDVLFGQTTTLALNVRGSAALGAVPLCGNMTTQHVIGVYLDPNSLPTTFAIPSSVLTYLGANANVNGLLALANAALNGAAGLPPLSDINTAVNNINVGFDGCRALIGCN